MSTKLLKSLCALGFAVLISGPAIAQAQTAQHCVSFDRRSTSQADFAINSCSKRIMVSWFDQGYCRTGCQAWPNAGGRETTTKAQGAVSYAACFYPTAPVNASDGRKWDGRQNFSCR